jgi:hypothetical protein
MVRTVHRWVSALGIDLTGTWRAFITGFRNVLPTIRDYRRLKKQNHAERLFDDIQLDFPCLSDRNQPAGLAAGPYFHLDLLVARRIHARDPQKHVDVGSRIDGFVAHVASFREIEVFDIRPAHFRVPNVTFRQCDFMSPNPEFGNYCDSLSCLHALEHFGLGRYGDPVNIRGHIDGFHSLSIVVRPGGMFYLSVPIGRERIEFNGHRVFAIETILGLARGKFDLEGFSYVAPDGDLHEEVAVHSTPHGEWHAPSYGFGLFEFRKVGS